MCSKSGSGWIDRTALVHIVTEQQKNLTIIFSILAILIGVVLAVVAELTKHPSVTPTGYADTGMESYTPPAPAQPMMPARPQHFVMTKAMDSALAAYGPQWERIRKTPRAGLGLSYTWTARVLSVVGERVLLGWPGHLIAYDMEVEVPPPAGMSAEELLQYNGMVSRGLPDVYKDDIVSFTGSFDKVTSDGSLEFDPKTLINYGHP